MQACADTVLAYWQVYKVRNHRKENRMKKQKKLKTKKNIVVYTGTLIPDQKTFSFLFFLGKIQSNRNNNAARHSNKKRVRIQLYYYRGLKRLEYRNTVYRKYNMK